MLTPTQPVCPDCGMMHPPIQGGCPMKVDRSADGKDLNWNELLTPLRQALSSKTKMMKLNSDQAKKLVQETIINAIKFIESKGE